MQPSDCQLLAVATFRPSNPCPAVAFQQSAMSSNTSNTLSFRFRSKSVAVTHDAALSRETAEAAMQSEIFCTWVNRCEETRNNKKIDIHSVEIQSVDMFGPRVGFVKIKAECTLIDGETHHQKRIPGICFLRGGAVAILVALICEDEGGKVYSLLVDQPRVPTGQGSCLELPAGMIDSVNDGIAGTAAKEMEEECGIKIRASDMTDLTAIACSEAIAAGTIPEAGVAPSPGGCDEFLKYLYVERRVSKAELDQMRGRLAGLREHGEYITLRVVSMDQLWKISADNKAMCALFLVDQLRKEGKLPPLGGLLSSPKDPTCKVLDGRHIPSLGFGLYKVPENDEGELIIAEAIIAGYRHFDGASIYGNEKTLGNAIRRSGIAREEFVISSKVWNDAQKDGPEAVRKSVEKSLEQLDCRYIDVVYVHWPVPGHFIETYKVLQELKLEGIIRNIGLSNFGIPEYEELVASKDITELPAVNQIEVSPFMYRPATIQYFQDLDIVVVASKALHRCAGIDNPLVVSIAQEHNVTAAQVLLRWGLHKGLIVVAKTSTPHRMQENREVQHFSLSAKEIADLDSLTSEEDVIKREELELQRRTSV